MILVSSEANYVYVLSIESEKYFYPTWASTTWALIPTHVTSAKVLFSASASVFPTKPLKNL